LKPLENQVYLAASADRVRLALENYRSDPEVASLLTELFVRRMEIFSAALALWGAKTNLTARPGDSFETAFHIIDSLIPLVLAKNFGPDDFRGAFGAPSRVLDFGSGAGFPGLILASACDAHFVLVEARQKRASFLKLTAAEMDLSNVDILGGRLTSALDTPGTFDAAISRASGPSASFYEIATHALKPEGIAILYSTPAKRLDLTIARDFGLGSCQRLNYTVRRADESVERVLAVWRKQKNRP
jgi:16S rRNA (guanine527-N7)-methyltransferase